MWRATLATALLLIGSAHANFFSEGGNGRVPTDQRDWDEYATDFYKNRQPQIQQEPQVELPPLNSLDEAKFEELLKEVDRLNKQDKLPDGDQYVPVSADEQFLYEDDKAQGNELYRDNQYFDQAFPAQPEQQIDIDLEKTKSFGGVESEMGPQSHPLVQPEKVEEEKVKPELKELPEVAKAEPKTPIVAQKKGQYEYVDFVEPSAMKSSKSVETVEKRRVAEVSNAEHVGIAGFSQSGNVMFLVAATVFVVATVTGGGIFY
uniref:Fibrous sheath CABYR-binding protein-like n=1 Tax=Steinernema glaseri TaxID=37863 RepID=A0A1I8ATU7_9BILA